jgi:hypothetical protein
MQAVPCNAADHIFCRVLGFHAVDVAFAGYTGATGLSNDEICFMSALLSVPFLHSQQN